MSGELEKECHLAEDISWGQNVEQFPVVADLERSVEHQEKVVRRAALLQHPVAESTLDDVAAGDALRYLALVHPGERIGLLRFEAIEPCLQLSPILVGSGKRSGGHRSRAYESRLDRRWQAKSAVCIHVADRRSEAAGITNDEQQRDQVARLRTVEVALRICPRSR